MSRRATTFRDDILASRGWFAALIVVYHLWAVPNGGPVGIDLFFVISGYLITRQLVDERARTGRISLVAFVARRIRRIAPVAVLVIVVTVLAAALLWYLPRAIVVAGDGLSAMALVANWHFIAEQHSYLEPSGTPSPLEHTWSLSVEEQFYLVWPVLVVLATLAVRTGDRRKVVARVVVLAVIALALTAAYSAWRTATAPDAAYFDTIARSWEFIPGIIAGALSVTIDRIDVRVRTLIGSLGFVLLAVSAFVLDPTTGFPWPGAVPSVLGATLFVAFGVHGTWALRVLTIRPAMYLGKISYPLYLWHFPIAIMLPLAFGRGVPVLVAAVLLSVLLADLTSRWLETPVLRSRWLRSWMTGEHRPLRVAGAVVRRPSRHVVRAALAGVTLVVVVGAVGAVADRGQVRATAAVASAVGQVRAPAVHPWSDAEELERAVDAAVTADRWPGDLQPGLDRAFTTTISAHFDEVSGCRFWAGTDPAELRPCDDGPETADRTLLLIGDSTAAAWAPGVADAFVPEGWRVRTLSFSACSPFSVPKPVTRDEEPSGDGGGASNACDAARAAQLALAAEDAPDLVVLSTGGETWTELAAMVAHDDRERFRQDWSDAVRERVTEYEQFAERVVVLGPAPNGPHTADCAVRTAGPERCETTLPQAEVDASCAVGAVECVDVTRWFCDADRTCPAFIGDTLVRADRSHLTERMARSLSGVLREALSR
ncbi:acyltransferase family protein [Curtobacterium sp. MCPF17_002]|uniref:acyltransferase family protein n=1 Tax=Curtobacterium sp. MCPF17_002 TaxID=2175645 RepID=UPI000DA6DE00|nr:acyltransferase family protein [Curtobacterium sp. MCPF17_002]WIB78154.1 acyltransferase family protein [Curtobacterium sp. MCPF17_002]